MDDKSKRTDHDLVTGRAQIDLAILWLRDARAALRRAGAKNAAAAVSKALKSAEGAKRHNERLRVGRNLYPFGQEHSNG